MEVLSEPVVDEMKKLLAPIESDWIAKARKKGVDDPQGLLDGLRTEVAAASIGK